MKKATVSFEFDEVKLKAIKKFVAKRNLSVSSLLESHMEMIYKKYVPVSVREYLEDDKAESSSQLDKKKGK